MGDAPSELPYEQPKLTNLEVMDIFITLLSELHRNKEALINTLPYIASQAHSMEVKMLILESATVINGQLIRICLAKALLGITLYSKSPIFDGCLNLERYLKGNEEGKSPKVDAIILTHLVIAEGSEVDAFATLTTLGKTLKPKSVVKLMSLCCKEAMLSKRALKVMLSKYK